MYTRKWRWCKSFNIGIKMKGEHQDQIAYLENATLWKTQLQLLNIFELLVSAFRPKLRFLMFPAQMHAENINFTRLKFSEMRDRSAQLCAYETVINTTKLAIIGPSLRLNFKVISSYQIHFAIFETVWKQKNSGATRCWHENIEFFVLGSFSMGLPAQSLDSFPLQLWKCFNLVPFPPRKLSQSNLQT